MIAYRLHKFARHDLTSLLLACWTHCCLSACIAELSCHAGLFDKWYDGKQEGSDAPMMTHTILTTDATKRFSSLHDRMPVILPDHQACMDWISGIDKNIQVLIYRH